LLVEEPPGEEYGSDGIEIDPVGGNNGSEFAHNPVPKQEAEHGGDDAQKEDAPNDFRPEDHVKGGETWYEPIVGNDGQESVEKHFPAYQLLGLLCINVLYKSSLFPNNYQNV